MLRAVPSYTLFAASGRVGLRARSTAHAAALWSNSHIEYRVDLYGGMMQARTRGARCRVAVNQDSHRFPPCACTMSRV